MIIGFPIFATMIVLGSWWASIAWSRYWGWDPKETAALVTWLTYAVYLHARNQRRWAGRPAALLLVIGFVMVLVTYSGQPLVHGAPRVLGAVGRASREAQRSCATRMRRRPAPTRRAWRVAGFGHLTDPWPMFAFLDTDPLGTLVKIALAVGVVALAVVLWFQLQHRSRRYGGGNVAAAVMAAAVVALLVAIAPNLSRSTSG